MLSLRTHAWITGGIFAAILVLAAIGNVLHDQGLLADGADVQIAARILFFGLTLALFFSAIPLMVKLVLGAQVKLGNTDRAVVRAAIARERWIVLAFWALAALGLGIALPAAIRDGAFGVSADDPAASIAAEPSRGTLVARPGMTVAELVRRSSLKLNVGKTVISDGTLFTFEIADTGISLPRCRYYFMTYADKDTSRIDTMSIGTSSRSMTLAEIEAADGALRTRLAADEWLAGQEVYRDEQDRTLMAGGPKGRPGECG
jgi:hypothetical protein